MPQLRPFRSKLLWQTVVFVAIAYGTVTAVMFFMQARLVFAPTRAVTATPDRIGLAFESVQVATADGGRLDGWWVPAEAARGVVLFLHGNGGNISHRLESLRIFNQLGLSTLIFDYRGYGRSSGDVSEQNTYRDAAAAWRYLTATRAVPASQIVLFGRSLGAAIAAHLAMTASPAAIILEAGFTSVADVGAQRYPFLPVRWLARFDYDTRAYLGKAAAPVLIVHSRDDRVIAFDHGRALFAAANHPKAFLEIRGGHDDAFLVSGKTYRAGLDGFLRAHLDR